MKQHSPRAIKIQHWILSHQYPKQRVLVLGKETIIRSLEIVETMNIMILNQDDDLTIVTVVVVIAIVADSLQTWTLMSIIED